MGKTYTVCLKIVLVAVIIMGGVSQARAVEVQDGCLIPYAYYTDNVDTAIGLMTWSSSSSYSYYWSFMSADGSQLGHGVIPISSNVYKYPFSLRGNDGNSHPGQVGYVIFTIDDDGTLETGEDRSTISATAILLSLNDAAYIPVIPLDRVDYANVNLDLTNLNAASIVGLSYGNGSSTVSTNCWLDPTFNAHTQLIIWSSQTPPANFTATAYSIDGTVTGGVSFTRDHTVLNAYDVETEATGIPAGFVDGLLDISSGGGERFIFNLLSSSAFSAIQTMQGFTLP